MGVCQGGTTVTSTPRRSISKMRMLAAGASFALAVSSIPALVATASAQARVFTNLYSFCSSGNCTHGESPFAGLLQDAAGNFYSTTANGGASGNGTVVQAQ